MSKHGAFVWLAGGAFLLILLGGNAAGQSTTGTILGVIQDETGGSLPGATVTATHVGTNISRTLVTDAAGRYRAPNLALGTYEVKVEMPGFGSVVRHGVQLTVGSEVVVDAKLKVGEITAEIQVTGEAPLVETTSSGVSGAVGTQQIENLPLNARSFEGLAVLQTGVAPYYRGARGTEEGAGLKFSVTGSRFDANVFMLDGVNINDQSNMSPGSAANVMLGVDMIREFRVMTSTYSAEYGRKMGGVINAVTKSGTNAFHGTAHVFNRSDAFDARNFFADEKPELTRNQFGGTLGGPIIRDRTFFFAGYEGLRQQSQLPRVGFVPSDDAHAGLLRDSRGVLRQVAIDPAVRPYLALYPRANGPVLTTPAGLLTNTAELRFNADAPVTEDYVMGRIDQRLSNAHTFYGRYTISDSDSQDPSELTIHRLDSVTRNQYLTLEETAVFSSSVVNSFRVGLARSRSAVDNRMLVDAPESMWFVPGSQFGTLVFRSGGLTPLGTVGSIPQMWTRTNFQVTDDLSLVRGRHTIKTGFMMERIVEDGRKHRDFGGTYTFDDLESFFQNRQPFRFAFEPPSNDAFRSWRQFLFGGYLQDDFQLRPNLTLNLGVRWEYPTIPTEANGKLSNFMDPLNDRADAPHTGDPWFTYKRRAIAPRLGFAWDPFSNGKTAVRGGFGLYHDHITGAPYNRAIYRIYPFHQFSDLRRGRTAQPITFPNLPSSLISGPDPLGFTNYLMGPNMQDPTKMSWTVTMQRELSARNAISLGYVGSRSEYLPFRREANGAVTAEDPATGRRYVPRPAQYRNPNMGRLSVAIETIGKSDYHAFQASFNQRLADGFQAQLSYTWSNNMSDQDGVLGRFNDPEGRGGNFTSQDPDNQAAEWAPSQFDMRHSFTANFSYELPFARNSGGAVGAVFGGWAVNGILSLHDGNPFGVLLGPDWTNSAVISATDRPDLIPGGNPNPVLGGPERYFDSSQFVVPPGDNQKRYFGNLGRNSVTGPGYTAVDFSLVKNTRLWANSRLQLRAEVFNLLNQANFGVPINTVFNSNLSPNPTAGRITRTTGEARQMQFGARLTF